RRPLVLQAGGRWRDRSGGRLSHRWAGCRRIDPGDRYRGENEGDQGGIRRGHGGAPDGSRRTGDNARKSRELRPGSRRIASKTVARIAKAGKLSRSFNVLASPCGGVYKAATFRSGE